MANWKIYENRITGYRERVKDGFSWEVLLLGPLWYLFNGMAGMGFFWFLITVSVGLTTDGFGGLAAVWVVAGFVADSQKERKYSQQEWKYLGYEHEIKS